MHRLKEESLAIVLVFIASFLDSVAPSGSLFISLPSATKKVNESFMVICRDKGGLSVTWRGPKGILGPKTRPKVETGSYGSGLNFTSVHMDDAGVYTCSAGNQQEEFNLSIEGSLSIAQQNATKVVNETFFISCADGAKRPISWRDPNGRLLDTKTRPFVQVASYGTKIVFNNVQTSDAGLYTCSAGSEQKKYHLTVNDPVIFMDTNDVQTGIEGTDVLLRCEVKDGSVALWSVENGDPLDKMKTKVIADGLVIKNVNRSDSKWYICRGIRESTGYMRDRKIKLRVLHKPLFTHPTYVNQEVVWSYINGTVNLTCVVVADPPAKFEWMKSKDRTHKNGVIIDETDNVSILQLRVDNSTFGNYKCVATNKFGTLQKRFSLERGVKPDLPKFIALKGANANFLDLEIREPDKNEHVGMETKGFNVQYKPKKGDHHRSWQMRDFNLTDANSYVLDDLEPLTQYEVMAATRNIAGLSDYTNISIFETLAAHAGSVRCTYIVVNSILSLLIIYNIAYW